jgi:hypothetical protein
VRPASAGHESSPRRNHVENPVRSLRGGSMAASQLALAQFLQRCDGAVHGAKLPIQFAQFLVSRHTVRSSTRCNCAPAMSLPHFPGDLF